MTTPEEPLDYPTENPRAWMEYADSLAAQLEAAQEVIEAADVVHGQMEAFARGEPGEIDWTPFEEARRRYAKLR